MGALARRWYVTVIALLLTAFSAIAVFEHVSPQYESQASILLVPGSKIVAPGANPLLYLGGLTQARDVLVSSLTSSKSTIKIVNDFPLASISIGPDASSSGPMLAVSVESPSASMSQNAIGAVLASIPTELTALQHAVGAPSDARIHSLVVAKTRTPLALQKTRIRATVGAIGVGLVITVLSAGFVDALLTPRKLRTGRRSPAHSIASGQEDLPIRHGLKALSRVQSR